MIDFHSHILPGIDDGSKNVEESKSLLKLLSLQGIDTVVATPHFIPGRESVQDFVNRRQSSYEELSLVLSEDDPKIVLGAEVEYYQGISRLEGLYDLCIGDSKLLLLEMPMGKWSESSVKELINLACSSGLTLVLAHIERYLSYQNAATWQRLLECDVLMQVNASFFNDFLSRRKAFKLLHRGRIHFLGSDCHNISYRPPYIGRTFDLIKKKLGEDFIRDFTEYQRALIFEHSGNSVNR